jgi:hypothetical protein
MRGVTSPYGVNAMHKPFHALVDITGYALPTGSYDDMLTLRDMLIVMAQVTYGKTADGDIGHVPNLTRTQLGKFFENVALQIHDAMAMATPTAKVTQPEHLN